MNQPKKIPARRIAAHLHNLRKRFAASLGVGEARRAEIYLELSKAVILREVTYWLQMNAGDFSRNLSSRRFQLCTHVLLATASDLTPLELKSF